MVGMFVCLCLTSKKPSEREFFVPAGTDLGVKLLRHSDFETRWPNAMEPPGPRQQQHNNQTMDERVGAQVARGDCMGGHSDLPFLPCCYYAKKWVVWGWLRWFRTSALRLKKERNLTQQYQLW